MRLETIKAESLDGSDPNISIVRLNGRGWYVTNYGSAPVRITIKEDEQGLKEFRPVIAVGQSLEYHCAI